MATKLIVVGTSLGGIKALKKLFQALPRDFPFAIAVVIHRHKDFPEGLVEILQRKSALPIYETEDKMPIQVSHIYMAPANYHLLIEKNHTDETAAPEMKFALSADAPVCMARPSIDVLFESCADVYGKDAIGLILTGGGKDGAKGLAKIQEYGGMIFVEDPANAEASDLPKAAIKATGTDRVYSLPEIVNKLEKLHRNAMVAK
jgi:two-component system chemotaxis response regulator CheB